ARAGGSWPLLLVATWWEQASGRAVPVPVEQVDPSPELLVPGRDVAGLPLAQRVEGLHGDGHRPPARLAERRGSVHARPLVIVQGAAALLHLVRLLDVGLPVYV